MKKILLICLTTLFSLTAWAYDFEVDGIYYETLVYPYENCCTVTFLYYTSEANSVAYEGDIVIPPTVLYEDVEYTVIWISNQAFAYCHNLTSVVIPETVTTIYPYAFYNCENLVSVNIPNAVTEITGSTFMGCASLKTFEIPESITRIGTYAFKECTGLESVTIGSNVEKIENYAFQNCTSLQSINIPNKVSSLGGSAFIGCTNLVSANIPDLVTEVEPYMFKDCTSLKTISLGLSVETISSQAFQNCTSLKEVYSYNPEPPTVSEIAFSNVDIKRATLYVPVGSRDEYLAADTWSDFYRKVEFTPPMEGDTFEYDGIFYNIISTTYQTVEVTYEEFGKPTSYYTGDLVIPATIEYYGKTYTVVGIGEHAFEYCSSLLEITLPETVTTLGSQVFADCSSLASVTALPTTPPTCGTDAFSGIVEECALYIPVGTYDDYSTADTWKDFFSIVEMTEFAIETLEATDVTDTSATLNGSITASYDNPIIEKGFEYWTGDNEAQKAIVEGDEMSAIVTNLAYDTKYTYRAYAKTEKGEAYGEEISFTTEVPEGISSVSMDASEIEGIYSTNGQKLDSTMDGVNIVRYSDRTTKKILIK